MKKETALHEERRWLGVVLKHSAKLVDKIERRHLKVENLKRPELGEDISC